jgi:hypothetical protein
VACKQDLATFKFSFTPEDAVTYLAALTADFLDPAAFDLLPFEVVSSAREKPVALQGAYTLPDDRLGDLPLHYARRLEEAITDVEESMFGHYWRSPLLDLANVRVPTDAFAKVRRRFYPLERGLAPDQPGEAEEDE